MMGRILVIVSDPDGTISYVNAHCEAVLQLASSQLVGRPLWTRLGEDDAARRMQTALHDLREGGTAGDDEAQWLGRSGEALVIRWGYSAVRDGAGGLRNLILAGYDVGRSQSVTAELGEALDRYQGILDTAVDGIITISERGLVESFNRAAERIFGYRSAEVVGRNVSMLMPAPYREQHDGYLDNYLTTRRKKIIGIGREVEGLRKDGTTFPLELSVGEVVTAHGRMFTGVVRDITDRKEAEAESRRRMNELAHLMRLRSMGELAGGLAHEVNQPLTAVISSAQACLRLLDSGNGDAALIRDALEQIARQGTRAAEVIRRLRKHVEKGELEKAPHDLNISVAEVLELLSHEFKVRRASVHVDAAPGLLRVPMDRVQIEQVLVNLVRNAVEAMDGEGIEPAELHIATCNAVRAGVDGVNVSVRDTGPGFAADAAQHLFDPFYTTKPDGLGQGLAICRRIVEAHHGHIWAEPAQPRGAQLNFWLPVDAA